MNRTGPVVLIEDDEDDRDMFAVAFGKLDLPNELIMLPTGPKALAYLSQPEVAPFVVISDINMPGMSGFELCDVIFQDPALRKKSIPFVFFTTSTEEAMVNRAYNLPIQGIFSKPNSVTGYAKKIKTMLDYWEASMLL